MTSAACGLKSDEDEKDSAPCNHQWPGYDFHPVIIFTSKTLTPNFLLSHALTHTLTNTHTNTVVQTLVHSHYYGCRCGTYGLSSIPHTHPERSASPQGVGLQPGPSASFGARLCRCHSTWQPPPFPSPCLGGGPAFTSGLYKGLGWGGGGLLQRHNHTLITNSHTHTQFDLESAIGYWFREWVELTQFSWHMGHPGIHVHAYVTANDCGEKLMFVLKLPPPHTHTHEHVI